MSGQEGSERIATEYERAKEILRANADKHRQLADLLMEREVIFTDDVQNIFGPRPWRKREDELPEEENKAKQKEAQTAEQQPEQQESPEAAVNTPSSEATEETK